MAALCYAKRNTIDPFMIESILCGVKDGKSYLAYADLYGNFFENDYIATSFARYLCPTLIDRHYRNDMSY